MQKTMADIEVKKFAEMVSAIGRDTLAAISRAGPETQVMHFLMDGSARKSVFGRKPLFWGFENNKDTDQSAHQHSLISTFIVCLLKSIISKLAPNQISLF